MKFKDLNNGKWYAIGFNVNGSIDYGDICQYEDGFFYNEDGEPVERLYDPDLEQYVSIDAADDYCEQ